MRVFRKGFTEKRESKSLCQYAEDRVCMMKLLKQQWGESLKSLNFKASIRSVSRANGLRFWLWYQLTQIWNHITTSQTQLLTERSHSFESPWEDVALSISSIPHKSLVSHDELRTVTLLKTKWNPTCADIQRERERESRVELLTLWMPTDAGSRWKWETKREGLSWGF